MSQAIVKEGVGFFKQLEDRIAKLERVIGQTQHQFFPGQVCLSAAPAASTPIGWLVCDGTAVSRTDYAALFAVIGVAFGVGNGTTTFNLPDLRGRTAVGPDASAGRLSSNNAIGNGGGAQSHTLLTTEIPAHSHLMRSSVVGDGVRTDSPASAVRKGGTNPTNSETENAGGGGSHNNMQPYQILYYIIKT